MYRKKLLRWPLLCCLALILTLLLPGCGKSPQEEVTDGKTELVFWHSYVTSSIPALEKLIERFEAEHPNIRIKAQYVQTGSALLQKLAAAISTETTPDLCWVHKSWVVPLSEGGVVHDLEKLGQRYGGFGEEEKNDIFEAPLQASYYKGKLRMMPIEATNLAFAYNRDLFRKAGLNPDKPPKDWKEFVEYGKKLTIRKGDQVEQWGCTVPIFTGQLASHTVWHWKLFLWGEGGQHAEPSGERVTFNSDAGVRALQFWVDLQHKHKIGTMTAPEQGFESQKVAMAFVGSWDLPHLKDLDFDWAIGPMPAGSKRRVSPLGGEYLVIFHNSEHPKEAWEFVRWFITPEIQAEWSKNSGYLPIRKSALESPTYRAYLDEDPGLKGFAEEVPYGYGEAVILTESRHIDRLLANALEKAVRRAAAPKQALDEAAEEANRVLAEAREKEQAQGDKQR